MTILWTLLIGLVIGVVAKFLMPGRDPGGILITIAIGIAGALIAGWLGQGVGWYMPGQPAGFIASVLGAMLLLFVYRLLRSNRSASYLVVIAFGSLLAAQGCSSKNAANLRDPSYVEQSKSSISPLKAQFETIQAGPAPLLAPGAFAKAKNSYEDAVKASESGEPVDVITARVSTATQQLADLEKNMQKEVSFFRVGWEAREQALKAGASEQTATRLKKIDEDFAVLGGKRERGRDVESQEVADLASAYRSLSSRAALSSMVEAKQRIEFVTNTGADKLMPRRLEEVQKHYKDVEQFVRNYPNDEQGKNARLTELDGDITRLQSQTEFARQISDTSPESVAVRLEGSVRRLESAAGLTDQTGGTSQNMGWQTRLENVINATEKGLVAQNQLSEKDAKLSESNQALATARDNSALSEKMKTARAALSGTATDVVLSNDQLILRLKNISFPSGKAQLDPQYFTTLSKVGQLIGDLHPANVTVEGHTDSVGAHDLNKTLSEDRAQAVSAYLKSLDSVQSVAMNAEGFAFDKPITSNKTKEGRAINRRIDIVLQFAAKNAPATTDSAQPKNSK